MGHRKGRICYGAVAGRPVNRATSLLAHRAMRAKLPITERGLGRSITELSEERAHWDREVERARAAYATAGHPDFPPCTPEEIREAYEQLGAALSAQDIVGCALREAKHAQARRRVSARARRPLAAHRPRRTGARSRARRETGGRRRRTSARSSDDGPSGEPDPELALAAGVAR